MPTTPAGPADGDRRSALLAAKLGALVRDRWGDDPAREASTFPGGAALRATATAPGGPAPAGWVLLDEDPAHRLGRAVAWADQQGVVDLHVLAEADADVLARRAAAFATPPTVWAVDGRSTRPAVAAPVHQVAPGPPDVDSLVALLEAADVDVVVEHGELVGEILGLEIARVVVDPEAGPRLEVGVGRHDREAFAIIHGDLPAPEALASVVDSVRRHRRADAPAHPLNRLAAERWLRRRLLDEPALAGAADLAPAEPTVRRDSVKDVAPAIAVGHDAAGPVVVACSTGIDLDLVPAAADAREAHAAGARLVLVLPERDAHPVTTRLAAALREPAEVRTVGADWRG